MLVSPCFEIEAWRCSVDYYRHISPFLYHPDLSKACGSFLLNELSVSRHGHFASGDWRNESEFPIHAFGVTSFEGNCSKLLLAWSKQAPANYVSARQNTPSDEGKILLLKSERLQKSGCSRGHHRATTMKFFVRTKKKKQQTATRAGSSRWSYNWNWTSFAPCAFHKSCEVAG